MTRTRETVQTSRYQFDFEECHFEKGWAQLDTAQDAGYYGNWANPDTLEIVTFAEGDLTRTKCDSEEEFRNEVQKIANFHGDEFRGIDGFCRDSIINRFKELGLEELLHKEVEMK